MFLNNHVHQLQALAGTPSGTTRDRSSRATSGPGHDERFFFAGLRLAFDFVGFLAPEAFFRAVFFFEAVFAAAFFRLLLGADVLEGSWATRLLWQIAR